MARWAATLVLILVFAGTAAAEGVLAGAVRGRPAVAPDGASAAEVVALSPGLAATLRAVAPESSVRIDLWPIAPGRRAEVTLTRHEVIAPDARIFEVHGHELREVARPEMAFLWGPAATPEGTQVLVAVTREGLAFALAIAPEGVFRLEDVGGGEHLVAESRAFLPPGTPEPQISCGQESLPFSVPRAAETAEAPVEVLAATHTATIAVDTDNELLSLKFSNNTTTAATYVASLIAAMNVMYERDLSVRLLQGTTYLRTSPDPYTATGSPANVAQLDEFGDYWAANYGSVPRALAMMLSGKSSSANSASGIAWVSPLPLCSTSVGYSFNQVFRSDYLTGDALVVGHELGHNFGSPHTHCYSPPIDQCYASESGCYSGATTCPAPATINGVPNVRGTLMSYCHLLSGCSHSLVFHPTSVALITPNITSRIGVCINPLVVAPTVNGTEPSWGPIGGGSRVAVTGTNFQPGATVSLGGAAAIGVTWVSPTRLTAWAPAHAAGAVTVTVTNPDAASGSLAAGYTYLTVSPIGMNVDVKNLGGSNLNGVFEPGETVLAAPSWHNQGGGAVSYTGAASSFGGASGATYTLADASADYGTIVSAAMNNCDSTTGNCFAFGVSAPAARPTTHWDATFTETPSSGPAKTWKLHIGNSFSDVTSSSPFYRYIETLLHTGVTAGCTSTTYCPASTVTRWQMAVFIAKAMAGSDANVPSSGTVTGLGSYNCVSGGQSLFADVPPTDAGCKSIHFVAAQGVTSGCGGGNYCPTSTVSRWQMAVFVAKGMVGPGGAVPATYTDPTTGRGYSCNISSPALYFTDMPAADAACPHAHYLWARDVVAGCSVSPPQYCPASAVTRDAMAVYLTKGFALQLYGP
ncbi:MAG: M12 family metallo-peptidase [Acidobacteriota bacterium]